MPIVIGVFVLVAAIVIGAYWLLIARPEQQHHDALLKRVVRTQKRQTMRQKLMKEAQRASAIPAFDRLLGRSAAIVEPIQRLIDQGDAKINVATFLLLTAMCFLAVAIVIFTVTNVLLVSLAAGLVATVLPYQWLKFKRDRRIRKFEEQFPEAIELIARALRAGHSLPAGLEMVADEMPKPVAPEFRVLYDQQNYGMPLPEALRNFAARIPLLDARFFVTAVLTQREAGGNLAEVLDNLAAVIRERFKVKRQVRAISAHGRITGWVLVALPPALAAAFLVVGPEQIGKLLHTSTGHKMIFAAATLQLIGTLIIRKIVRIEY